MDVPLTVDFHTSVAVAVLFSAEASLLFARVSASSSNWSVAVAVAFFDADVFGVTVFSAGGRAWVLRLLVPSVFPFSALYRYSLLSLDLSGLGCLLFVSVCRREDAERDSSFAISRYSSLLNVCDNTHGTRASKSSLAIHLDL